MSELTKKRVHWKEYNGEELIHDEDVDVLTSAGAVTFEDGETMQYKYSQGQFVSPSDMGVKSNLSTTNKSTLVDAINEVKTAATSNQSSITSLTNRMTTAESDIDNLEKRVTPISLGGTGATTSSGALSNLGLTATASELNVLDGMTATTTELNYVDGVTSAIQTQLDGKANSSHNHSASNITSGTLPIARGGTGATTASGILTNLGITSTASELNVLDGMTATTTELNYVDGVTSAIQTQLNGKASSSHNHSASNITSGTLGIIRGGTGATTSSGAVKNFKTALIDLLYPVGSIHMSVKSDNPSTYFGGTWVSWGAGRVPVGVNTSDSSFSSVEKTGGDKTITLGEEHLPIGVATDFWRPSGESGAAYGSGDPTWAMAGATHTGRNHTQGHNNLQPYITCYMWKRTE